MKLNPPTLQSEIDAKYKFRMVTNIEFKKKN